MPREKMPLPTRRRALELGAGFIEADLDQMRADARARDDGARGGGPLYSVTHCLEHDLMKVAEWASAAATLRALAAQEER